ncbi:MAG TPA: hypothetical protein VFL12_13565 [Thermoanaerobaculia bacterium]|nr:hypothetical protein [Thermoanaerobaculia bacterium]
MFDYCFRCGVYARAVPMGDHVYCPRCAEIGLNDRPNYRNPERRAPEHAPRGFGRRFRDILRPH